MSGGEQVKIQPINIGIHTDPNTNRLTFDLGFDFPEMPKIEDLNCEWDPETKKLRFSIDCPCDSLHDYVAIVKYSSEYPADLPRE